VLLPAPHDVARLFYPEDLVCIGRPSSNIHPRCERYLPLSDIVTGPRRVSYGSFTIIGRSVFCSCICAPAHSDSVSIVITY